MFSCHIDGHDFSNLSALSQVQPYRPFSSCIVSSTANITDAMKLQLSEFAATDVIYLNHLTPIPIRNLYSTPQTLGTDRLASVTGAYYEAMNRNNGEPIDVLVIDMGTAITYDIIDAAGNYLGGNISPGVLMRLKALHHFTDKLPLVELSPEDFNNTAESFSFGDTTQSAIINGVVQGVKCEIKGVVEQLLLKYPRLLIFLTGGDYINFDEQLKKRIFADKFLVAKGLNIILQYNAQIK